MATVVVALASEPKTRQFAGMKEAQINSALDLVFLGKVFVAFASASDAAGVGRKCMATVVGAADAVLYTARLPAK